MKQSIIDFITIWGFIGTMLGTAISIISARVAYLQYKKAQNASESAMQAKKFILERKMSIDLINFITDVQKIERTAISYLKTPNGRNADSFTKEIQGMLSKLNMIKSKIDEGKPLRMELNRVYDSINRYSWKLQNDKSDWYKELLGSVRELISTINSTSNKNIYQ